MKRILPVVLAGLLLPSTSFAASADGDIEWDGIFADTTAQFVSPAAFSAGDTLTLRLRAKKNDLTGASCTVNFAGGAGGTASLAMSVASSGNLHDTWACSFEVPNGTTEVYYRFVLSDGADVDYYDAGSPSDDWTVRGMTDEERSFQDFRLYADFDTPAWSKGAVFYQIFPDRFFDGAPDNNRLYPEDCFWYLDYAPADGQASQCQSYQVPATPADYPKNCLVHDDWTELPNGGPCDYFGGDLSGIEQKLRYLEDLGVDAVYLNPIFRSPSNHKYDTIDYEQVDPRFGELSDLDSLVQALHARGQRIVLDGVFNHVSDLGRYYNYWSNYALDGSDANGQDAFADSCGAWEQSFLSSVGDSAQCTSPYSDWFHTWVGTDAWDVDRDGNTSEPAAHTCGWAGLEFMPELDYGNPASASDSGPRTWLYGGSAAATPSAARASIAGSWLADGARLTEGLDGWRLDVPDNAGYFTQATGCDKAATDPTIWQGFRRAVKTVAADRYISGEIWVDAANAGGLADDWFRQRTFDGVMNYRYFATPLSCFLNGVGVHDDPAECQRDGMPPMTLGAQSAVDALDAHLAEQRRMYPSGAYLSSQNLLSSHDSSRFVSRADGDIDRLRVAQILQATLPGAPMIYYGDEIALEGANNELGRSTMPWSIFDNAESERAKLRELERSLICLRNAYPALRTGSFITLHTHNGNQTYGFARFDDASQVVVVSNASAQPHSAALDLPRAGIEATRVVDLLSGTGYDVAAGQVSVSVPANSGVILVDEAAAGRASACRQANRAPIASANHVTIAGGEVARLDASGSSDPEDQPLEFTWIDDGGQILGQSATLDIPGLARGEHAIHLRVSDGVYSDLHTVMVTVTSDGPTDPDAGTNPPTDGGGGSDAGGRPDAGIRVDGGTGSPSDAADPDEGDFTGCTCRTSDRGNDAWMFGVFVLALIAWRRRAR